MCRAQSMCANRPRQRLTYSALNCQRLLYARSFLPGQCFSLLALSNLQLSALSNTSPREDQTIVLTLCKAGCPAVSLATKGYARTVLQMVSKSMATAFTVTACKSSGSCTFTPKYRLFTPRYRHLGDFADSVTLVCRSSSHAKLKYIRHSAPSDATEL